MNKTESFNDFYDRTGKELYQNKFQSKWLTNEFLSIFHAIQEGYSLNKLIEENLLNEIAEGIYSFPCFTTDFCHEFLTECENYIQYAVKNNISIHRPNSMNRYGLVLNLIGMENLITDLQQTYLLPISRFFFPIEASHFTNHHSFIVSYEPDRDRALDLHTDDSDVTWNICLGKEFIGSGLTFCGIIGKSDHRQYKCSYQHVLGHAVVHLGEQRHGAENIIEGERHNLIIWCRNENYRRSELYHQRRSYYEKEANPPDLRCLSYTHDRDYILYHDKYPPGKNPFNLSDGIHDDDEAQDLPMPWCPPVAFGYDGLPTPNQLMKIIYTKLVEEEEERDRALEHL